MIQISGRHNTALCHIEYLEMEAQDQIRELCDQEAFTDTKIRIMPDAHAGAGCVIGFTSNINDAVVPNLIGVDIGCGMYAIDLGADDIDLETLDSIIKRNVPSGFDVHKNDTCDVTQLGLLCIGSVKNIHRQNKSMGTLGGGNHFIELDESEDNSKWLVIHSGSRNLGLQVAQIYQELAWNTLTSNTTDSEALIAKYKEEGREKEISSALAELKKRHYVGIPKDLAYLTGELKDQYLHDMRICQQFAKDNREAMSQRILVGLRTSGQHEFFHTVHNYIGDDDIVRKGAISAHEGERVLIPFNMRDGSIIGVGKGNPDWNYSAPHGAGRIMSRSRARKELQLDTFKQQMTGVFSTTICQETIDEAPDAYKPAQQILDALEPTVTITQRLLPLYNFKAK